jgi:hypothetical protein
MTNREVGILAVVLHLISSGLAFITSQVQTRKIIKDSRRQNIINASIMIGGGAIALIGTSTIMKVVKRGAKQVEENNKILRGDRDRNPKR